MLTVSATLTTNQAASNHTPYLKVVIHTDEGVSTETFENNAGSNPIIYMRQHTQIWASELEVLLFNGDQGLAAKDYTGRRIMPDWGYTDGVAGDESATHEPYWVVDQEFVAFAGTSFLKLTCWGVWDIMGIKAVGGDGTGAAPSWPFDTIMRTMISADILAKVILKGFASGIPLTVPGGNLDVTSDFATGIFKEYKPHMVTEWGQNARAVVRQIMDLTKCGLRMRDTAMHVLFPASADAVNQTYQDGAYEILAANLHIAIAVPNRVIYVDNLPTTAGINETHKGEANDTISQGRIGIVTQIFVPQATTAIGNNTGDIAGNDEAQQRADTILLKVQAEASIGTFITHPNIALEVWDKVSVIDPISGVTTGGRVGGIETIWDATGLAAPTSRYLQTVELGGISLRASNLAQYIGDGTGSHILKPRVEERFEFIPSERTPPFREIEMPSIDEGLDFGDIAAASISPQQRQRGPVEQATIDRRLDELATLEQFTPRRPSQRVIDIEEQIPRV